jgi:hypothetical protein
MTIRHWVVAVVLTVLYGCAIREDRCSSRLRPINVPATGQPKTHGANP